MVRIGPEQQAEALARPHVRKIDFTGRPMRGMIMVAAAGLENDTELEAWVQRGVAFASGLPAK
jgi:hypothetical protein